MIQRLFKTTPAPQPSQASPSPSSDKDPMQQSWVAYEPDLMPPLELMRQEGISVLEEWFRWAEEWSMLLRVYGGITASSAVLEIGCGLGRTAFPLRYVLTAGGSYDGFEICRNKVEFLERTFHKSYPHFRFVWANVLNTFYNPEGQIAATDYRFPYADSTFDLIYAASVFTHMVPENAEHYFQEAARVLKPGGRCLFSVFLLDNYRLGQKRPLNFSDPIFNVDHPYGDYGKGFALCNPRNPEEITAYSQDLIGRFAEEAGMELAQAPIPGLWSGTFPNWVGMQDLVVLKKIKSA